MSEPRRIVLLDSSGVLHRCFHGYVEPKMATVDGKGMDVAGVYGYFKYIRTLTNEMEYERLIHIIDPDGGSAKRLSIWPQYKGNRQASHPVLSAQKTLLPKMLEAFGQTCIKINGVESDDIIATLVKKYTENNDVVLVVTQDKDLMQLVSDGKCVISRYVRGENGFNTHEFYEENDVLQKLGVRPDQVADFLSLTGDASDNIPGVMGVGDKTAAKLLLEYGSLSSIMTNVDNIKGAVGDRIRKSMDMLPLYKELTTVFYDVDVDIPSFDPPVIDEEKNKWARQILGKDCQMWPDDIVSDLIEPEFTQNQTSVLKPKI